MERVRTKKKALDRLVEIVEERANGKTPVRVGVLHANDIEGAKSLVTRLEERLSPAEVMISGISPVIGSHVGPGTLGVAVVVGDPLEG